MVLQEVDRIISQYIEPDDLMGHVNADHFVVFLSKRTNEDVERILKFISDEINCLSSKMDIPRIGAYFGVTEWVTGKRVTVAFNEANKAKHNIKTRKDIYYAFDETANLQSLTKIKNIDKFIKTIDLIKLIYKESKLKKSCCISTFNYYLYLISLVQKNKNWDKKKLEELKQKMKELEKIFLKNFEIIQKTQSQENIKKYIQYKNDKKIIFSKL